jgi:DNA-binding transcriptional LysR family regulator
LASHLWPPDSPIFWRDFRQHFPEVQVAMRDMVTPDQIEALKRGDIDVGFVRLPVLGVPIRPGHEDSNGMIRSLELCRSFDPNLLSWKAN